MSAISALVALALGLGGCGVLSAGTSTESGSAPTTTQGVATVAAPPAHFRAFRMPSGNVGCRLFGEVLRCDILSGVTPEPAGSCELDWAGFTLDRTGPAEPACAGDSVYAAAAPVLAFGRVWARAGVFCEARKSGLHCFNAAGHGFVLARARSGAF